MQKTEKAAFFLEESRGWEQLCAEVYLLTPTGGEPPLPTVTGSAFPKLCKGVKE